MPSTTRECGHRIIYGEIPCRDEWLLISDVEYDRFTGTVDAERLSSEMLHMLLCTRRNRGRLSRQCACLTPGSLSSLQLPVE
jgi:hypothetical protein